MSNVGQGEKFLLEKTLFTLTGSRTSFVSVSCTFETLFRTDMT